MNLSALKKAHSLKFRLIGSAVNAVLCFYPLIVTFIQLHIPATALGSSSFCSYLWPYHFWDNYCLVIPYFGGGYWIHGNKAGFEEYRETHSFLPPRGYNAFQYLSCYFTHSGLDMLWIIALLALQWGLEPMSNERSELQKKIITTEKLNVYFY